MKDVQGRPAVKAGSLVGGAAEKEEEGAAERGGVGEEVGGRGGRGGRDRGEGEGGM